MDAGDIVGEGQRVVLRLLRFQLCRLLLWWCFSVAFFFGGFIGVRSDLTTRVGRADSIYVVQADRVIRGRRLLPKRLSQ